MDAKKCDRCGKFYEIYFYLASQKEDHGNCITVWNIMPNGYENHIKKFDLCKSCMTKLETFLGMNKETEKYDKKGNT